MVWSPLWPSVGAAARDAADEAPNAIGHVDDATQITDQVEFDPGLAIKFTIYPARAISRSAVSSGARSASARTEPTLTDNDQKHVAVNDRVEDVGAKVRAKRDTIDIHEDRVLAVMDDEAIANTTRHHVGIGTAIRDRDLWYQGARQDGRNKRTTRGGKSIDPSLPAVRGALHYLSSSPRPERSRTSRMAAPIIAKFVMAATVSHRQRWSK